MKEIIKATTIVLATLATLFLLLQFSQVLLVFLLSLFLGAAIRPSVNRLVGRGLRKGTAQIVLYAIGIVAITALILFFGDEFLGELNGALNSVVIDYRTIHFRLQDGSQWQQTLESILPPPLPYTVSQDAESSELLTAVINLTRGLTSIIGSVLLLLALSVYWSVDQHRFERIWLSLLPVKRRAYARDAWREIENGVGEYLRRQFVQSMAVALLLGFGSHYLLGFPYPTLLALFGAAAAFVPLFGGALTAVIAAALGTLESVATGAAATGSVVLVFLILEFVLGPRLRAWERRGFLLTLLMFIPMLQSFGPWGLILTPIFAVALDVMIRQAYTAQTKRRYSGVHLGDLETRLDKLRGKIADADNVQVTPELKNFTSRLETLLTTLRESNAV